MKEIIENIKEGFSFDDGWGNSGYDGVEITTNKQKILIGIDDGQQCCEEYGYISSNDNYEDFIGAEVRNVKITDTALKTIDMPYLYEGGCIFVTLETSKGDLQLVMYNEHNGYYGHKVIVKSEQLSHEDNI